MGSAGGEMAVGLSGTDLVQDLLAAIEADKSGADPDPETLERWQGVVILARLSDNSPVYINKLDATHWVDDGDGGTEEELVSFNGAVGEIESVSPAYGGSIALTGGERINLPHSVDFQAEDLGLEIEVLDVDLSPRS